MNGGHSSAQTVALLFRLVVHESFTYILPPTLGAIQLSKFVRLTDVRCYLTVVMSFYC